MTCNSLDPVFCGAVFRAPLADARPSSDWPNFSVADAGRQIFAEGTPSEQILVLCAGWAFRYIQLPDGGRQILKFLLPGDMLSSLSIFEEASHFSVKALTRVQIGSFPRSEIRQRCSVDPGVQSAMGQCQVADAVDANEFLAVLGQRSAEQRVAHLLLHLIRRIAVCQVVHAQRYPFPLRQQHIADTVGLTTVHVSRVFGLFRERRIVVLSEGVLEVFDHAALERIGSLK